MQNNLLILIVDGNADALVSGLRSSGFEVASVPDGQGALDFIEREGLPHLAVIDTDLPGPSRGGLDLAKDFYARGVPVIITTARHSPQLALESLRMADDYVRRPFDPAEVVARVRRVLSRVADLSYARSPLLEIDDNLQFDYTNNSLIRDGERIRLTPIESRLLHTLMQHKGHVVDSRTLIARVWASENIFEDTLRVHIHRLRGKVEDDPRRPRHIVTERGVGYSFQS